MGGREELIFAVYENMHILVHDMTVFKLIHMGQILCTLATLAEMLLLSLNIIVLILHILFDCLYPCNSCRYLTSYLN